MHALVNEGRAAGSSLPHSHSQLVWLRDAPPVVVDELPDALTQLLSDGTMAVARREGLTAAVHRAGRLPYETLIGGEPFQLAAALRLLRDVVAALQRLEGPLPWNAWLHDGPRPHLELVPRLSVLAGAELGAGLYINTLAPEDAAAALRNACRNPGGS